MDSRGARNEGAATGVSPSEMRARNLYLGTTTAALLAPPAMEDSVKKTIWLALSLALFAGVSTAQPSPTPTPGTAYSPLSRSSTAAGTQLMTGTVWAYEPGKSISIRIGGGKQYDMTLEPNVRVDGSVAVGQLASLMWTTDNAGKTRVMSITAAPGSAMDIERSAPSVPTPTRRPTMAPAPATSTPETSPTTPRRTPRAPRATPTPSP